MTTINLVLRPSSKDKGETGSLSLRMIHRRRVKTVTLPGCRLYKNEWDMSRQEIIYPSGNRRRQVYLAAVEQKIDSEMEIVLDLLSQLEKRGSYTVDDLVALYRRKQDNGKLTSYAESLARELDHAGQCRTAGAYRTVVRGLVKFNNGADIPLEHINGCLIKGFEQHLKSQGKLPNTIAYYMRNLRAIYNKAVSSNHILNRRGENPFAGVSTSVTKTMKRALSLDELKALHTLDFKAMAKGLDRESEAYRSVDNLYRAWRYFFFCFYARGMCFVDLAYLRKENIRDGFIRYCRRKTGQQIEIRITDELQSIMDSFARDVTGLSYVFPIITDPDKSARVQYESAMRMQNERLKKLASLARLGHNLSTHVARHSWASAGKVLNLPLEVISECLGHNSPATTLIYTARLENSLLDEANSRVAQAIRSLPDRVTEKR